MSLKIWVMRGLQGSGKSTKAINIVRDNKNTYRVNKDLLRQNLYCDDFNPNKEQLIAIFNDMLVENLLQTSHNIVSDNMNLTDRDVNFYHRMAEKYGAEIEIINVDTPLDECVARDEIRRVAGQRYVGKDIIISTAFRHNIYRSPNKCVVTDLDGTLCDVSKRRYLVDKSGGKKPDWDEFSRQSINDAPRLDIIEQVLRHKKNGLDIIIVSGCSDKYRDIREKWLKKHGMIWDRFIMRNQHDRRPDTVIKREFIHKVLDKSKIQYWYDDRVGVIDVLKEEKINVIDVGDGTFL